MALPVRICLILESADADADAKGCHRYEMLMFNLMLIMPFILTLMIMQAADAAEPEANVDTEADVDAANFAKDAADSDDPDAISNI